MPVYDCVTPSNLGRLHVVGESGSATRKAATTMSALVDTLVWVVSEAALSIT